MPPVRDKRPARIARNAPSQRRARVALAILAVIFALSLVAGAHIASNTADLYEAHLDDVFIVPYGPLDALWLIVAAGAAYLVLWAVYRLLPIISARLRPARPVIPVSVAVPSLALFALYIPYLLTWWPGFVFADTVSSIWQHAGVAPLSNHHPVAYTAFLGVFMDAARSLGGTSSDGLAASTMVQMAVLAVTLGHLIAWIASRLGLRGRARACLTAALVALFGVAPYFATYAIALWKDPLFTVGVIWMSVLAADLAAPLSPLGISRSGNAPVRRIIGFAAACLLAMFMRNNGVYVVCATWLALAALALLHRRTPTGTALRRAVIACAACIAVYALVSGPVYDAAGIQKDTRKESYGVLLNQMARVAALDGDMSASDRAYLDRLLPLDRYAEVYAPTNADHVKGAEGFDQEALGDGFFGHWLSLLVRNPRVYVEAWELETFGFWAPTNPLVLSYNANISGGGVMNGNAAYAGMLADLGVTFRNLIGEGATRVFVQDCWSPPVAWAAWLAAAAAAMLALRGHGSLATALVPSAALMGTLLVATPIHYWPRYAAALHFLIPFYLALIALAGKEDAGDERQAVEQVQEVADDHARAEQVRGYQPQHRREGGGARAVSRDPGAREGDE